MQSPVQTNKSNKTRKLAASLGALALAAGLLSACSTAPQASGGSGALPAADGWNMEIIGYNDLNGAGKGGEGLALKKYPDGRRVLFLAHEAGPMCVTVLDVTNPTKPTIITQVPGESPTVRCNSLSLSGDILAVAHQTPKRNEPYGGLDVFDVSNPAKPELLSYFDTHGPTSGGVHFVWFTDGRYAWLTTGAKDFEPKNPIDNQFVMVVDLQDPRNPKEAGRWWFPGQRKGDPEPMPPRLDAKSVSGKQPGYRPHTITLPPDRPNRAYVGYIDGGVAILDITDLKNIKMVTQRSWRTAGKGFAHTFLPIKGRHIAIQTEEAIEDNCLDWPKRNWVWDITNEDDIFPLAPLPPPKNFTELCNAGGRFGAHNINMNRPNAPLERPLYQTVVGSYFGGGVRAYSIADPDHPEEIGYIVPKVPTNKSKTVQINDMIVDENGLIYANDRFTGGMYVIKYTGSVPLR